MENFLNEYGLKWIGTEASAQKRDKFDATALNKDIENSRPM